MIFIMFLFKKRSLEHIIDFTFKLEDYVIGSANSKKGPEYKTFLHKNCNNQIEEFLPFADRRSKISLVWEK